MDPDVLIRIIQPVQVQEAARAHEKLGRWVVKKIPVGDFQPFIDGKLNSEMPPVGSWIEVLWPDMTITTHKVGADSAESHIRVVTIDYHGFQLGVLLCCLPPKARYVHWVEEDDKPRDPCG